MLAVLAALSLAAPVPKSSPDWVTLKGTVVWPEKQTLPERKEIDLCGLKGPYVEYMRQGGKVYQGDFVVDEKSRGLAGVVVWLRPDDDDPKAEVPGDKIHPDLANPKPATHTLNNEFCRFERRVLVARAGDTLRIVNKGQVVIAPKFDIADEPPRIVAVPADKDVSFGQLPAGVGLFRDLIHQGWKDGLHWPAGEGVIRVFDHPYFAVTGETGEFVIPQVPKGKWRLVYWHRTGFHKGKDGALGLPIDVAGDAEGVMTLKPLAFESPKTK